VAGEANLGVVFGFSPELVRVAAVLALVLEPALVLLEEPQPASSASAQQAIVVAMTRLIDADDGTTGTS
jgi:ABC-type microcin C transport system duplicated ATPase subunit YejF